MSNAKFIISASDKTKKAFTSVRSSLNKIGGHVSKVSALFGGISVGGLALIAKNAADGAVELRSLAQVGNTAIERFQHLAPALHSVNISQEKYADILKDSTEKMGEFIGSGSGPMDRFFTEIAPKVGLTANAFQNLSGDQVLQKYYNALEQANLSQAEMTSYMEEIASDSTALIPLLRDGGAAFEEQAKRADQLGLALTEIEVGQLAKLSETIKISQARFSAFTSKLAAKFAPTLQKIGDYFEQAAIDAGGMGQVAEKVFNGILKGVGFVADALQGLRIAWKGLNLVAAGFNAAVISLFEATAKSMAFIIDNVIIAKLNFAIEQFNRIPGVADIALVDTVSDSGFMKGLSNLGERARNDVSTLRAELHNLAMQALPSDQIDAFVMNLNKVSEVAANSGGGGGTGGGGNTGDSPEIIKQKEDLAKKLVNVETYLLDEQGKEQAAYMRRLEVIKQNRDLKLIDDERFNELVAMTAQKHQTKLTAIEQKGWTARQKFTAKSTKDQTAQVMGEMGTLTQGVAQHSKTMFKINKVAAISNAVISTHAGVAKSLESYPWPLAGIMAGLHLAAGLQRVKAIKAQSFGGGGAGAAPTAVGTGGNVSNPQVQQVTPIQKPEQQKAGTTIIVNGDIVGNDAEKLFDEFKGLINDGDHVLIETTSRNGQQIAGAA
jgi:hypothetical protein